MSEPFLPYGRQCIDEDDISAVSEVLRGDYLTTGPAVATFELDFAAVTGAKFALSCANGTAALHLAMLALRIGKGDVAIVPSLTFLATANAARFVDAEVHFADVDPETGLMTADTFTAAMETAGARARVVIPVHLNGQCCDMARIRKLAAARDIGVIEDACHALGGHSVGNCEFSEMATFSLHPVKTIAAGEGGVITTNDPDLAERVSRLRNHGMVRQEGHFLFPAQALDDGGAVNPWYYEMHEVGFNYRLSDINAALARNQLKKLSSFAVRRRAIVARYDAALADLAPIVRPIKRLPGQDPVWHLYVVRIDFTELGESRSRVIRRLREKGIGTQVHYLPVHRQPYYQERYGEVRLPGADAYYDSVLSLPLFPSMSEADVDRVVGALSDIVGRRQ